MVRTLRRYRTFCSTAKHGTYTRSEEHVYDRHFLGDQNVPVLIWHAKVNFAQVQAGIGVICGNRKSPLSGRSCHLTNICIAMISTRAI